MSSNPIRILLKSHPHRSIALCAPNHVLTFRHNPAASHHAPAPSFAANLPYNNNNSGSNSSLNVSASGANGNHHGSGTAACMVDFSERSEVDLSDYHPMGSALPCRGTLGLISLNGDVFLCVVTGASLVATVRPGETVYRIHAVEFHCLNSSEYDNMSLDDIYSQDFDYSNKHGDAVFEHPCAALRKMLSEGTFYYSTDFDLTNRLQNRSVDHTSTSTHFSIDTFNESFLWNMALIKPLLQFRSRLPTLTRTALDSTRILTSAIRGYVETTTVNRGIVAINAQQRFAGKTHITIISRLSCRRAGTRFNSRGMDDDGHVANFVETETVIWDSRAENNVRGVGFSYTQVRGSVPLFWEQQAGLLPGQQKVTITRSPEATQPSFDRHIEGISVKYGAIHIVNLLSALKPAEAELTRMFDVMIRHSPYLGQNDKNGTGELIKATKFDFHEETRAGYEAAAQIRRYIEDSADSFAYFLTEDVDHDNDEGTAPHSTVILQQEGVFRTNCLDCLDRTNLIQQIISQMAIERFLRHRNEKAITELWSRHSILWADNGDALSRIYAGTGALKSSFTRSGKSSLGGVLADFRKSATRMYINNFADKGRQNTIDMLLGRLVGQDPVLLYDPINDYVNNELSRRSDQFMTTKVISIHVGTMNLNGRTDGIDQDLTSWLFPPPCSHYQPELIVVGFQEIVELSPQQIMSTDPERRQLWESAVLDNLNRASKTTTKGKKEYILLRGGQLVGAALGIYVRSDIISQIKNVEGSLKKTGMSGLSGNKGAVAIRFDYGNTRICLVTAHLAAGFANYDERNRDYRTIANGLRFQRGRSIDDHDVVIWLGDFNYRIGLNNEETKRLINSGDLGKLYENDQLNLQMVAGLTFPYYSEARLTFLPTYRFDINSDDYDTSDKMRIPAWCDRILRKGSNVRQLTYNSAPLKFSDHRPVYATFEATIQFINEEVKEKLSQQIYASRRDSTLNKNSSTPNLLDEDESEEDLIGYDPIAPGLPPASTDMRKWWLDHGVPAKSTARPPGDNYELNTAKMTGNPFAVTSEKDWVKKEAPAPPPARGTTPKLQSGQNSASPTPPPQEIFPPPVLRRTTTSSTVSSTRGPALRKLPPPYDPTALPPLGNQTFPPPVIPSTKPREVLPSPSVLHPTRSTTTTSVATPTTPPFMATSRVQPVPPQPLSRSPSISSTSTRAPPPKPKKPSSLAGSTIETSPQSFKSARDTVDDETVMTVAARIRGMEVGEGGSSGMKRTVSNPVGGGAGPSIVGVRSVSAASRSIRNGGFSEEVGGKAPPPPLPQRRHNPGNLMDEAAEGVSGWMPLTPGK
ncbi:inositol polyphosphate 5-phosphatase [Arthrobotrys musiformis]|uniref:phosphoinositide 5-phosphatase n=1 Tax=Arthrobotrys musiformis TaxID=47236 RepID=A0AAV9WFN1_9PEZI